MKLLSFLLNQKLFVHFTSILIIVIGTVLLLNMQREARPNVNFNRVNVSVAYPGSSPSDIEELLIDPIEEKIEEVDGVDNFRSVSYTGAGSISVEIDDTYPNPDEIADELRQKISEVRNLPADANDPVVSEAKASNIPVIKLSMFVNLSAMELKIEAEKLKDFLKSTDGVQSIAIAGTSDIQIKIKANLKKLESFDISLIELMNSVKAWTNKSPGGVFENQNETVNISINKNSSNIDSIKKIILRSNYTGKIVYLEDVAQVSIGVERLQNKKLYEDKDALLLTIVKKPFSDAIKTVDLIKENLAIYRKNLNQDLKLEVFNDQSLRIRDKLKIVSSNAISGLGLLLIILLVFLNWRSAIVTAIGIPIAILGGIIALVLLGNTLNSLVVVGIIIALGMLVDDAIVVCENIHRHVESGEPPKKAVLKGVQEVAVPVLASVLTTVFAFLPIVFMEGIMGQFLKVIPITVICLLTLSLIEAIFILPIHAEELMMKSTSNRPSFFSKVEKLYKKYVRFTLSYKWIVTLLLFLIASLSVYQGKKLFNRFSLFPAEGLNGLSIRVEGKKNTPLDKTKRKVQILSVKLKEISENTFDTLTSDLGQVITGGASGSRQNGSHLAMVNINFTSNPDFIYQEKRILKKIRETTALFSKEYNTKTSITLDRPGPPIGKPIQFQITSRNFETGKKIAGHIKKKLTTIKGVHSIESDLDGDLGKYNFSIDNEKISRFKINRSDISRTIFAATSGVVVNEVLQGNEKIEISVETQSANLLDVNKLLDLEVKNTIGKNIPLKNYMTLSKSGQPSSIQRLNGIRTITLFGEVDDDVITGKEVNKQIAPFIKKLKEENSASKIETGGGEKDRLKTLRDTMKLYIGAIVLIFMIISLTFNSVFYPLLVLSIVPMGLCGVVWSLLLHGKGLTLMGIIGVVGLTGVVVNVSILFLKFIQDNLKEGNNLNDSIANAGVSRLRPIIMTTTSTLIGLLPTIYGIGGVDTFVQPIALVLGWGLFVATLMALLFLPALISCFGFIIYKK